MNAKAEAEDLVNTYRIILMNEDTDCGNEILCTLIAKKCALITLDEQIKENDSLLGMLQVHANANCQIRVVQRIHQLKEVKQEIEKL